MKGDKAICPNCEDEFVKVNVRHKFCCYGCGVAYNSYTKPTAKFYSNYKIFERDSFRCFYCGDSSIEHGVKLTIDHLIPTSRGGTDEPDNLVTACPDCNAGKSSYLPDDETVERCKAEVVRRNALADSRRTTEHERKNAHRTFWIHSYKNLARK